MRNDGQKNRRQFDDSKNDVRFDMCVKCCGHMTLKYKMVKFMHWDRWINLRISSTKILQCIEHLVSPYIQLQMFIWCACTKPIRTIFINIMHKRVPIRFHLQIYCMIDWFWLGSVIANDSHRQIIYAWNIRNDQIENELNRMEENKMYIYINKKKLQINSRDIGIQSKSQVKFVCICEEATFF